MGSVSLVDSKGIAFLRKSHAGCDMPPAYRQVPAFDPLQRKCHSKAKSTLKGAFYFGGLEGDRTLDLTDANRTLSQLSYEPI